MSAEFVLLYRPPLDAAGRRVEMLVSVGHIWKIEVLYGMGNDETGYWRTSLEHAAEDPAVTRFYRIHFGSDVALVAGVPGDRASQVFESIYKRAVKGD